MLQDYNDYISAASPASFFFPKVFYSTQLIVSLNGFENCFIKHFSAIGRK